MPDQPIQRRRMPARSDAPELRDTALTQGADNAETLMFETESASKPVKLILQFDSKVLQGTHAGFRYTIADPSFRVDVRGIVPNTE